MSEAKRSFGMVGHVSRWATTKNLCTGHNTNRGWYTCGTTKRNKDRLGFLCPTLSRILKQFQNGDLDLLGHINYSLTSLQQVKHKYSEQ